MAAAIGKHVCYLGGHLDFFENCIFSKVVANVHENEQKTCIVQALIL